MFALGFTLSVLLGILDFINVTAEIPAKVVFAPVVVGFVVTVVFGLLQVALLNAVSKPFRGRR